MFLQLSAQDHSGTVTIAKSSCMSSNRGMRTYSHTRWLLQQAAVSLPPAPSPSPSHFDAANQRAASSQNSSSTPAINGPFTVSSQFSPTMVIILVILLSAFFFMGFFAIYVRRCSNEDDVSERRGSRTRRQDGNTGPQCNLGVDPSLVESFPVVSYAAAKKKGCNECVVCLADFERGEELKQLPKCKHVFHPGCIGLWLESHTTCPLCRRSLVGTDRWSMSWRWGASSRGGSLSSRINEGGGSVSYRDGEQSLPGRGGSSVGGSLARGRDSGSVHRSGLATSPLATELRLQSGSWATSEIMPQESDAAAEVEAPRVVGRNNGGSGGAAEGRRMRRSNSTGHSLLWKGWWVSGRRAVALPVGCMALGQLSLCRSRSVGEERTSATSEGNARLGGSGWSHATAAGGTATSTSSATAV